jgi:serine-type D-Ala-D-Ala carboxypeptidase/endopeptidase (penicillin-binding protein 4)
VGDETFFDALRGGPTTSFKYGSDVGGMLSALTLDRGRPLGVTPGRAAARRLRQLLESRGVDVVGSAVSGTRPEATTRLAEVTSPSLARIAQITNRPSSNFRAEMLLKDVGARYGTGGSTAAGAAVVAAEAKKSGVAWQVADGSGLSRTNLVSPRGVVRWIASLIGSDAGPAFRASLAVPGSPSGTLWKRMRGTTATTRCRAKTGTLRDTSSLAGVCAVASGRTLYFAFLANGVNTYSAKLRENRMAARLASAAGTPAS